jgi:hypothetical protein
LITVLAISTVRIAMRRRNWMVLFVSWGNDRARWANEVRLHQWFPLCSIERHLS